MNRLQTFHEALIPMLVECVGARTYLELGTGSNETIARVRCEKRIGVDANWVQCPGVIQYTMHTDKFLHDHAAVYAPYDVVFLDASHDEDEVWSQIEKLWPLVSPDGLILIHDTNPETVEDTDPGLCGSAWRIVARLEGTYEAVTLPYHPGLTIIRKRIKSEPKGFKPSL
jgi:methyltransferase family protein